MAVFFPIGFYNPPSEEFKNKTSYNDVNFIIAFLFVNPESLNLYRDNKIAIGRTFNGTVARPWETDYDVLTFSGKFFGYRSWVELYNFMESTKQNARNKEIALIYKYVKYWGYIKDLKINTNSESPFVYDYNLTFISKQSIELYRLMLGVTMGFELDEIGLKNQFFNAKERINKAERTIELLGQTLALSFFTSQNKNIKILKDVFYPFALNSIRNFMLQYLFSLKKYFRKDYKV